MSSKIMVLACLVGGWMLFYASPANSYDDDCRFVPERDRFTCNNKNWVNNMFKNLRAQSKTHYVAYVLMASGCQLPPQPIDHQVKECERQLGVEFACRVTISLVKNLKIEEQHFYPQCNARYM